MNEEQIKAGDHLLIILKNNGGMSTADDYPDSLRKAGFTELDVRMMILSLEESGIIEVMKNNTSMIRLTNEGYAATQSGLPEYFKRKEEERKLELKALSATVESAEWTKKHIKIAKAIGAIGIVLSMLSLLIQLIK
jgi:hypothetical protein